MNEKTLVSRECELKFSITSDEEERALVKKMESLGFSHKSHNLESDYTPDVQGFLCRENGLILRFRVQEGDIPDVLITLKISGKSKEFQDNYEVEYYTSRFDAEKLKTINAYLKQAAGHTLPNGINNLNDIQSLRKLLANNGFTEHRMLSQKKRSVYESNEAKIAIDEFPKGIGKYIEIEANTPEELFAAAANLGLDKDNAEKRNYGEIIKDKQKTLPENEKRTLIFDNVE